MTLKHLKNKCDLDEWLDDIEFPSKNSASDTIIIFGNSLNVRINLIRSDFHILLIELCKLLKASLFRHLLFLLIYFEL